MIYAHALNRGGRGVRSPADLLWTRVDVTAAPDVTAPTSRSISLPAVIPPKRQPLPHQQDRNEWLDTDEEE